MDIYDAVMIAEGEEVATERELFAAIQHLINEGVWNLQGSMGRSMMDAIQSGICALGPREAFDYWGNRVPARHEIRDDAPGSARYVEENSPFGGVLDD